MIAAHNQSSSRAGSRLGQYEDNGTGTSNSVLSKEQGSGVVELKEDRNQEAPRHDDSPKQNSTAMPNTIPSGGIVEEDEEDEEEDEEDRVRVGEMDEEEDEDVVEVESVREKEMPGPVVAAPSLTSNGRRGTIGVGMGMAMKDMGLGAGVGELRSSGGGGMGGYWNRQSRPSSPRMPPPEQPETRPKSRHEPAQPARYNNLGYWRARRVTFYKNGDPYFPGVEFRLVAKHAIPIRNTHEVFSSASAELLPNWV